MEDMQNRQLYSLIDKYLNGKCTPREEEQLLDWYTSFEEHPEFTDQLDAMQQRQLKEDMQQRIHEHIQRNNTTVSRQLPLYQRKWAQIAAAVALLLSVTFVIQFFAGNTTVHQTAYGEMKTIMLPDHSVVKMNGNSTLSYTSDWENTNLPRQVWLDGEAFFSVTHQSNHQKFLVHTSDSVQVEVLGTEFNVSNRIASTEVALKSGSIKLHIRSPLDNQRATEEVLMVPGEVVVMERESPMPYSKVEKKNAEVHYAWQNGKMLLDNTTLGEVITRIVETYGLKIHLDQADLGKRRASGSIPLTEQVEQLIENVALLYEVELQKSEGQFLLKAK